MSSRFLYTSAPKAPPPNLGILWRCPPVHLGQDAFVADAVSAGPALPEAAYIYFSMSSHTHTQPLYQWQTGSNYLSFAPLSQIALVLL